MRMVTPKERGEVSLTECTGFLIIYTMVVFQKEGVSYILVILPLASTQSISLLGLIQTT